MFIILIFFFVYPIINIEIKNNKINNDFSLIKKEIYNYNKKEIYNLENQIKFLLKNDSNEINILFHGELIFVKYYIITFIELIFAFLIILYGAYYYIFGLSIQFSLFVFYNIILIYDYFKSKEDYEEGKSFRKYLYIFTFSIFSGNIISFIIYNIDKKTKSLYIFMKIIYGCIFGFFLFKSFIYYYLILINNRINKILYFLTLLISISFGGFTNFFLKKYEFLPCSIVSGSYFIITSIAYIFKQYYADIIFIKKAHINSLMKNVDKEIIYTLLFIQIVLIIICTFYQINHFKNKISEDPYNYKRESLFTTITQSSDNSDNLVDSHIFRETLKSEGVINTNEEEEVFINDQED